MFPNYALEQADALLSVMGTHWSKAHQQGLPFVRSFLDALASCGHDAQRKFEIAKACLSRTTTPAFLTERLRLTSIQARRGNRLLLTQPRFGEGYLFDTSGLRYGAPITIPYFSWSLSDFGDTISRIGWITDSPVNPQRVWIAGVDYYHDPVRRAVVFLADPFDNGVDDISTAALQDRSLQLWCWEVEDSAHNLRYEHIGYALGIPAPPERNRQDNYGRLLNTVFDAAVTGSSSLHLRQMLSAIFDVPIVQESEETVVATWTEARGIFVATDQHVYRLEPDAELSVAVDQVLQRGDFLTTTVRVLEVRDDSTAESLDGLALGSAYLTAGMAGPLCFPNRDVPLQTTTVSGRLKVTFELGGWPGDIDLFFDTLHAKGIASGQTLAQLLDRREQPLTEPTADSLPSSINPLVLLLQNVLRYHATIVKVSSAGLGPNRLDWRYCTQLRGLMAPQDSLILLLDQIVPVELIPPDGDVISCVESPETWVAGAVPVELIGPESVIEKPQLFSTGVYCVPE